MRTVLVLIFFCLSSLAVEAPTHKGHSFFCYLRRLGISEKEVLESKGKHWLSMGTGKSTFVSEATKRGVDTVALNTVVNPLPYHDGEFDRVVSVWFLDFNNPETGKKTLSEMLRVTKIGGDIRINPVQQSAVFTALDEYKKKGLIEYATLPYFKGSFKAEGKNRFFELEPVQDGQTGSVRITRLK